MNYRVRILLSTLRASPIIMFSLVVFSEAIGVVVTFTSGFGWAVYMVGLRLYLRGGMNGESTLVLTMYPMVFGLLMLLGVTALTRNIVNVSLNTWIIVLWLSVVNTALAFVYGFMH